tara:strand:+ start:28425 stop:29063 length:639 start_codon:yes stop_codon:yes gene_type:complete
MDINLSGNFFIDVLLLALILALPIPTTPFLVYLVTTQTIYRFGILYFIASNIFIFLVYCLGYISSKVNFFKFFGKYRFIKTNPLLDKTNAWIKRAEAFSVTKLKDISIWNIIVLRMVGIHPILVSYGSGFIKGSLFKNILANSVLAILDIIFYWAILGSGQAIIQALFPNLDLKYYIEQHLFSSISIILIGYYAVLIIIKLIHKFVSKKKNY